MLFCQFLETWNHPDIAEKWDNSCSFLPFPEPWQSTMSDWGETWISITRRAFCIDGEIPVMIFSIMLSISIYLTRISSWESMEKIWSVLQNNHCFYTCFHSSLTPNKDTAPPYSIQYSTAVGHYATKIKQIEKNIVCYHIYVDCKKIRQTCELNKKEATHRYRGKTSGYRWGEGSRGM